MSIRRPGTGPYDIETVSLGDGRATAIGAGGPFTLVVDRPAAAGGGGLGFSGGQLLNLAVAGCVSNDLFREAARTGMALNRVTVRVRSDYAGSPAVSTPIEYEVEIDADASDEEVAALIAHVDEIAEIPNSIRNGTEVRMVAS